MRRLLLCVLVFALLPFATLANEQRIKVSEPRTWYVNNVTGDDDSDCSQATPCKSIQKTVNLIVDLYDFAAQPTIQLATTGVAYAEAVVLHGYSNSLGWRGWGNYTFARIVGDPSNNAAVVVHPSTGWAFTSVLGAAPWILESLTIKSTTAGGINADAYSRILGKNLNFGQVSSSPLACQILAQHGAFYEHIAGPFKISGGGWCHVMAHLGGSVKLQGPQTVVISNAPAFYRSAVSHGNSIVDYSGVTWSGCVAGCIRVGVDQAFNGLIFPLQANNATSGPWW